MEDADDIVDMEDDDEDDEEEEGATGGAQFEVEAPLTTRRGGRRRNLRFGKFCCLTYR